MNPAPTRTAAGGAPPEITLQLSLDELNLMLEGVGSLPFARVFNLVGKIQAQAAAQLQAAQDARDASANAAPQPLPGVHLAAQARPD